MITLIGTGHVFDLRHRLQREVLQRTPDVVCLELDPLRLQALLARQRGGKPGNVPVAYRMLAEFQDRIAAERGIAPGDEMLAAFEAAQGARVPVELIDLDAQVAFQQLWKAMGIIEKARFLGSALIGSVMPKRFVEQELARIQDDYEGVFEELARDYPTVKRVLIDERNTHMAARLAGLRTQGRERVVAVVGDGHVEGITALLEAQGFGPEIETVRLRELQAASPQPGPASVSFQTEVAWSPPGAPPG